MKTANIAELNALFIEVKTMQKPTIIRAYLGCDNKYEIAIVSKSVFKNEAKQVAKKINSWFIDKEISITSYKWLFNQLIDNLAKPEHDRIAIQNMRLF